MFLKTRFNKHIKTLLQNASLCRPIRKAPARHLRPICEEGHSSIWIIVVSVAGVLGVSNGKKVTQPLDVLPLTSVSIG